MSVSRVDKVDPAEPSRTRLAWRRAVVLALPVLYVAGSAVRTEESSPRAWLAIAIGLAVALFGSLSHPGETTRQGGTGSGPRAPWRSRSQAAR